MLRLTNLSNKNKRRTLRALYANSQGYPYAATLDVLFQTGGAGLTTGALAGTNAIAGATAAIMPGMVMTKEVGEIVYPLYTAGTNQRAFGLCANFVGGTMDELYGAGQVGVWRGAGSVYEVLAPAHNDTNLASETAGELGTVATEVYMDANANGQLQADSAGAKGVSTTARAIQRLSANAVIVELLV